MNEIFKLGDKVRDVVSGFEGIATAKVEFLNGCIQYCLKPPIDKKKPHLLPDGEYFDSAQLELVKEEIKIEKRNTGGDMSDPPSDNYKN